MVLSKSWIHDAMFLLSCSFYEHINAFWSLLSLSFFFCPFLQSWDSSPKNSRAPNSMKIVLFADFASSNHGLNQAQYMLKQLCNEGHQITLFGKFKFICGNLCQTIVFIFGFRGKNPNREKKLIAECRSSINNFAVVIKFPNIFLNCIWEIWTETGLS